MTKRDDFVCLRCLQDDEKLEISGPDKEIQKCSVCGVENWCLPVKGAKSVEYGVEETIESAGLDTISEEPSEDAPLVDSPPSSKQAESGTETENVKESGLEETPVEAEEKPSKALAKIAALEAKIAELKK